METLIIILVVIVLIAVLVIIAHRNEPSWRNWYKETKAKIQQKFRS